MLACKYEHTHDLTYQYELCGMSFEWHASRTATATATIKTIGRPAWKSIEKRTKVGRIMLPHVLTCRGEDSKRGPGARDQARERRQATSQRTVRQSSWAETETVTKTEKDGTTGSRLNGKLFACWTAIGSARTAEQSKRSHWPGIRLTIPIAVERLAAILALWPPQTITTATTKEMPWNRHLPASYSPTPAPSTSPPFTLCPTPSKVNKARNLHLRTATTKNRKCQL